MISTYLHLICFLSLFIYYGESYKILVICPIPARSHHSLGKGIADILHDAQHEITFITHFKSKESKYREIEIKLQETMPPYSKDAMSFENLSKDSQIGRLIKLPKLANLLMESTLLNDEVQDLLNDKQQKFDLVIEEYFTSSAFIGFGVKFDCPVIMISPVSLFPWLARLTGNPISPATVPNVYLKHNGEMNFFQRFKNTLVAIFLEVYEMTYIEKIQAEFYNKYFPDEAVLVPHSKLYEKISLIFSNTLPSLGNPRPLLPNVIEVGGYFIKENQTIPEDFLNILDNAKNGVILFSMGSNLKSADIPGNVKSGILSALGKRKETILWKYEEDLPQKPKNVIIRSWMPQASILTHPNLKLLINHGGLLSTMEAVAAGVPIISVPVYSDQFYNAETSKNNGYGILLNLSNITKDSLIWAMNEVIGNRKYSNAAKKYSKIYHDRPMKAKELIVFYTEHVIRTNGAKHLSAPHLPLYSLLLLDVIAVIVIPFLLLSLFSMWICRRCRKKVSNEERKTKSD